MVPRGTILVIQCPPGPPNGPQWGPDVDDGKRLCEALDVLSQGFALLITRGVGGNRVTDVVLGIHFGSVLALLGVYFGCSVFDPHFLLHWPISRSFGCPFW